ncbi:alpha/beta hydrolase [Rhodococcus pyridinivorans]|uniref:alpha/beta hydrolase n=1 Tax=Rhodococcus pyridinivorans TaxID=103816 RepID=UPI002284785F|nr:alpha/beta hydrolase [Rhodococcus pyridinivorans]WAL49317.1 alpha/beta hydrolase [Rhodococcus pyridinivorans]
MTLQLDSELATVMAAAAAASEGVAPPERGDALALRETTTQTLKTLFANVPPSPDVNTTDFVAVSKDGTAVPLRWYTRGADSPSSAIVYVHGGGMICGSVDLFDPLLRRYVQLSGVPFLAVDYRLAPEHTETIPAEDAFAAIEWLVDNADRLGVDLERIALMGDSGGGGVGAGAAILARANGVQLARQILIYPMLDDRNTSPDSALAPTATWTYDNNYTGWHALLGDNLASPTVPAVAAPARLDDPTGLAPAYIEVGELDIFRDECIEYARRLLTAGVSCELHVIPGAPHAHDLLGMPLSIGQRSLEEKIRVISAV